MRYLRMLSNSVFAGVLAAVFLTMLLLDLNPAVPLTARVVGALLMVALLAYGIHIAVASYALYVLRQIAIVEQPSPGWISLRLLTWSAALLSGTAAMITWLHATGLKSSIAPAAVGTLTSTAICYAIATTLFLVLGFAQIAARPGHRTTVAVLFTIVTILSIVTPPVLRGRGGVTEMPARLSPLVRAEPVEGPRVVLICLDGASLDVISPAVAAGRLPNFGRLLERGASMHLATTR